MAASLSELLKKMLEINGSDLHITTNSPPQIRVDGSLRPLDMPPLTASGANPAEALAQVQRLYQQAMEHLRQAMQRFVAGETGYKMPPA